MLGFNHRNSGHVFESLTVERERSSEQSGAASRATALGFARSAAPGNEATPERVSNAECNF